MSHRHCEENFGWFRFRADATVFGASDKHREAFHDLSHYRKCRRLFSQVLAAQLLRIEEVLRSIYPDLAASIRLWVRQIEEENIRLENMGLKDRKAFLNSRERAESIAAHLPAGAELAVSPTVSPNVLKIGKLIYDKVLSISEHSVNMKLFESTLLLKVLLPWSGYNILTRKAQTRIVDKFYLRFIGFLHGTTKINYQELTLYYGVVRALMPQSAYDVLYNERHLVYNASESSTESNGALDDGIESGIVKDTKTSNVNNKDALEKSTYWVSSRASAKNVLKSELAPSRSDSGFHGDSDDAPGLRSRVQDREKATAQRRMFSICSNSSLREAHIANEFICNVLTDPHETIKDKLFVTQFLDGDDCGRRAASMHLCCKLWTIFGDLTEAERNAHFNGKPMDALRRHWKKNLFKFKSMADYLKSSLSSNQVGFKRKQRASKIIENMHKRFRSLVAVKGKLDKIIHDAIESDVRRHAAILMKQGHEKNAQIQCSMAYAFRKHLEGDEPFRESRSDTSLFYENLQSELGNVGALDGSNLFVEREPHSVESGVSSIHVDVTDEVRNFVPTEDMGIEVVQVGGAVFAKMSRKINPFVTSSRYKNLVELHIHVDVIMLIPPQIYCEKRVHHDFGKASSSIEAPLPPSEENNVGGNEQAELVEKIEVDNCQGALDEGDTKHDRTSCETNTDLTETWCSLMSIPGNHHFLTYLHAVYAAKAAVHLMEDKLGKTLDVSGDNSTELELQGSVFVHGAALAVSKDARNRPLSELVFGRRGDAVMFMVEQKESSPYKAFIRRGEKNANLEVDEEDVDVYDTSCCWQVSPKGIQRYTVGDSGHALSQTRVARALETVTRESFMSKRVSQEYSKALVVSESEEGPLVTLMSKNLGFVNVFYKIGERYVDIKKLCTALYRDGISPQDLALLHAIAGGSVCPSTQHVSQKRYLEAYFCLMKALPREKIALYDDAMMRVPPSCNSKVWDSFETLIATAFLFANDRNLGDSSKDQMLRSLRAGATQWALAVRRHIAADPNIKSPLTFLPEREDLDLQVKRAAWYLRFCLSASGYDCNRKSAGGLSEEWGFKPYGYPLFERPRDVLHREGIIKTSMRKCKCTTGCKNKRCSCVKEGTLCLFCECNENCENDGRTTVLRSGVPSQLQSTSLRDVHDTAVGIRGSTGGEQNARDAPLLLEESLRTQAPNIQTSSIGNLDTLEAGIEIDCNNGAGRERNISDGEGTEGSESESEGGSDVENRDEEDADSESDNDSLSSC